jgi:hypothetical protein
MNDGELTELTDAVAEGQDVLNRLGKLEARVEVVMRRLSKVSRKSSSSNSTWHAARTTTTGYKRGKPVSGKASHE